MADDLPPLESILNKNSIAKVSEHVATQKIVESERKRTEEVRQALVDSMVEKGMDVNEALNLTADAVIGSSSAEKTGFPYNIPDRRITSAKTSLFATEYTQAELDDAYERNPWAKAIIDWVVDSAFDKGFVVVDPDNTVENIDQEFQELYEDNKVNLINGFKLGRKDGYSLIFYKYIDAKKLDAEVNRSEDIESVDVIQKALVASDGIIYETMEDGTTKKFPITIEGYKLDEAQIAINGEYVHASRVEQIRTSALKLDKQGQSVLVNSMDSLTVLKHIIWGAGQGYWRSGNLQHFIEAPPRATTAQIQIIDDAMLDINARTAHTVPSGTKVSSVTPRGLPPLDYQDSGVREISASTEIPKSKLTGAQPGEMASAVADKQSYYEVVSKYQKNTVEPILNAFYKRFQESGQLEHKGKFKIIWKSPEIISETDQSNIKHNEALVHQKDIQMGVLHPDEVRVLRYPEKSPLEPEQKEDILKLLKFTALSVESQK